MILCPVVEAIQEISGAYYSEQEAVTGSNDDESVFNEVNFYISCRIIAFARFKLTKPDINKLVAFHRSFFPPYEKKKILSELLNPVTLVLGDLIKRLIRENEECNDATKYIAIKIPRIINLCDPKEAVDTVNALCNHARKKGITTADVSHYTYVETIIDDPPKAVDPAEYLENLRKKLDAEIVYLRGLALIESKYVELIKKVNEIRSGINRL